MQLDIAYTDINTQWKHLARQCRIQGDDDPESIMAAIEDLERQISERLLKIATDGEKGAT
jgi:hypothetical protein